MAISFPSSPTLNQQFTADGKTWIWDGEKWVSVFSVSLEGPTGPTGPAGTANYEDDQAIIAQRIFT